MPLVIRNYCIAAAIAAANIQAIGAIESQTDEMPLRVAVSGTWGMPFVKFQGDQVIGGLVPDIAQALAAALKKSLQFVVLPGKRFEAASVDGQFDLRCYLEPTWVKTPEAYEWSGTLFSFDDVIIGQRNAVAPHTLQNLQLGARVSVVDGYFYPGVDPKFKSNALTRDVSPDQIKVLAKVARGHTPYGISNVLALNWFLKQYPEANLSTWQLPVGHVDFQCVVPHASPLNAIMTFKLLNRLKQSGELDTILSKYR